MPGNSGGGIRMRLAVAGRPVMHSMSPVIFRKYFTEKGINGFYSRIAADTGKEVLETALLAGLDGFNVTSPFKNEAAAFSADADDATEKLDASNTIVIRNTDGRVKIRAYNTDFAGVHDTVLKYFKDPEDIRGRKAFIAGAGGAGLAAAYGLSLAGFNVTVFSRNPGKTISVIKRINNCRADKLENMAQQVTEAAIIVNALPVADIYFNPRDLDKSSILFDADYKNRPLEKAAAENNIKYISGFEWLLAQAEYAYKIFSGAEEKISAAEIIRMEDLVQKKYTSVSLIGFMGTGKTAAGYKLAELTGKNFIDIDLEIEKREALKISEIFSIKGEDYFRKAEKRIIEAVLDREYNCIISCGGGAVIDGGTRGLLKEKTLPVWLVCPLEISAERIKDGSRPLLDNQDKIKTADNIYKDRIDYYGETSELIINSGIRKPFELAGRINEEISNALAY